VRITRSAVTSTATQKPNRKARSAMQCLEHLRQR